MARRLVAPKTAKSEVWKYFGFEADESGNIIDTQKRTVTCRLCNRKLLFSGNTTNLSSHFAACHGKVQQMIYGQVKKRPHVESPFGEKKRKPEVFSNPKPPVISVQYGVQHEGPKLEHEHKFKQDEPKHINEEPESFQFAVGGDEQQYCLKWKFHQSNQQDMFSKLLEKESFCDVTIACEEKILRAHKLLLSACSSYFEMILSLYDDKHPVVILRDVSFDDMAALLQFIYKGEIIVEKSQMASLLKTADFLKIRGLTNVGEELQNLEDIEQSSGFMETDPLTIPEQIDDEGLMSENSSTGSAGTDAAKEKSSITEKEDNKTHLATLLKNTSWINSSQGNELQEGSEPGCTEETAETHHTDVKDINKNISIDTSQEKRTITITGEIVNKSFALQKSATPKKDLIGDVMTLPDFLNSNGTFEEFWKKSWVVNAMKAVSNRHMSLRACSDLLGVTYSVLYARYRQVHGCIKEGSPGTSRRYMLKVVHTENQSEGGNIILRRDELSPSYTFGIKNEKLSGQHSSENIAESMLSDVILENSATREPACELNEVEDSSLQYGKEI